MATTTIKAWQHVTDAVIEAEGPADGDYIIHVPPTAPNTVSICAANASANASICGPYEDADSLCRAIEARMDRDQFWPNVWAQYERGDVQLVRIVETAPGGPCLGPDHKRDDIEAGLLDACRMARGLLAELDAETCGLNMHEVADTIGRLDTIAVLARDHATWGKGDTWQIRARRRIEAAITRAALEGLRAAGLQFTEREGWNERQLAVGDDVDALMDWLSGLDEAYVDVFRRDGLTVKPMGWVRFIYGNDGWDCLADHVCSLEAALAGATRLAETLSDF